jgi:hypothetical protein
MQKAFMTLSDIFQCGMLLERPGMYSLSLPNMPDAIVQKCGLLYPPDEEMADLPRVAPQAVMDWSRFLPSSLLWYGGCPTQDAVVRLIDDLVGIQVPFLYRSADFFSVFSVCAECSPATPASLEIAAPWDIPIDEMRVSLRFQRTRCRLSVVSDAEMNELWKPVVA